MLSVEEQLLDRITETFYHLLNGRIPEPIPIPDGLPDNEVRQLMEYINRFLGEFAPFARAMQQLAEGDLDAPTPPGRCAAALSYKALQSNLRHLTWKTQRIANGRLDETVDFMGEFSAAFNSMTRQLQDSFQAIEQRNEELHRAYEIVENERERSDALLLNVLPASVADELKDHGSSEPQSFSNVTVFFSDIVDFTHQSAAMAPSDLIRELNGIVTRFDEIIGAHGCERIKTIGDAYLAVCGMPEPNPDHAASMVAAALEILDYMRRREGDWRIRIGIHSGHLVGGIVGVKKYIYDVFGDTINTASRMETCSEPMRINLSATTYELIREHFPCIPREPVEVKGKGLMKMYFVQT